jgi:hypothetical protein
MRYFQPIDYRRSDCIRLRILYSIGLAFFQQLIIVCIILGLLFCSVLCGLVGLSYLMFDPVLKHIILNRLVLRNSSDMAGIWENPPITPHLKVREQSRFLSTVTHVLMVSLLL